MSVAESCSHKYAWGEIRCGLCGKKMGHTTWLFKVTQTIRDDYLDGRPLNPADRKLILGILRGHPDGRRKFGNGVSDVFVHPFIGGHRCFWAVHGDGSVEDFSVRKALGRTQPRSPQAEKAMLAFDTRPVLAAYRRARQAMA